MEKVTHRITQIESQKRREDRVNIYLDGTFAFGLDKEVALKYQLHEGDELTESMIDDVLLAEERTRAKQKALALLSYRARSVNELRKKLKEKDFSERTINRVIEDFLRVGLLDDTKFASDFVHSKMAQKPMGKRLLRQELFSKGVDEETTEKAIAEVYGDRSEIEVARELTRKRVKRYGGSEEEAKKKKRRLSDFLLRRGFDWEVITTMLQEEL